MLLIAAIKLSFSQQEYKIIAGVFVGLMSILVIQGIYEYYFDPMLFKVGIERYEGALGRISTTFFNTIYYGIFINCVFVFLLTIYARVKNTSQHIALGILLLLVYCNLIFTFTRSSFMIFWGILALLFFFDHKLFFKKSIQLILALLIALTLSLNGSVNFVTASFESTASIVNNFNDILNLIPDFLNIGKKTVPVVSIQFEKSSFALKERGATLTLKPLIAPSDATNQNVIWSTDHPEIADVDSQGKVTAMKNGTAVITAKTKDGNKTATTKVVVEYKPVPVSSIQTSVSTLKLDSYMQTEMIEAVVLPETAENRSVVWSSSDELIATVDQDGMITARLNGAAIITVKSTDGKVKTEIIVTVEYLLTPVTEIKLNMSDITLLSYGETKLLKATVYPENATVKKVIFASNDPSVVIVNEKGLITAMGNGTATITVSALDQSIITSAIVNVSYNHVSVSAISFNKTTVMVSTLGKVTQQQPAITPQAATIKTLIWSSSDKSIATVDELGKVLALKNGVVIITASTLDGGFSASYELTVKQYVPIPDYSLIHRNEFAKIATRIGNDHFFTGIGFGCYLNFMDSKTFALNYPDYLLTHTHPHSAVILLFAETGALSLMAFLLFALALLWMSLKNFFAYKNNPSSASSIAKVLPTLIIGFLIVCSIAENAVYDTQVFALFLIITGLSFSFCASQKKEKTVLYVASAGGHLTELLRLKPLFPQYRSVVITEKTETTKTIRLEGVEIAYLGYASRSKMIKFVWMNVRNAIVSVVWFIKYAPHVIVTTGANTAVPLCLIGKLMGSKIVFIETVANSEKSSITGMLLYPVADLFIVQWESMRVRFPKAVYWGWLS
jgi:uncharacterized protein YjdB